MKRKSNIIIFGTTLFIFCFLHSCDKNLSVSLKATDIQSLSVVDSSLDSITAHPRLLLKSGEESQILAAVNSNADYKKIHDFILKTSDSLIVKPVLEFQLTGKRLLSVSQEAFRRLYYLSYSYRMTDDVKYLNRASTEIHALCNFTSWNHSHFLDVGEMCIGIAIAYDWLYDDLSDSTKTLVRQSIIEKAFNRSNNAWWLTSSSNWNAVCNTGLLYAALAIYDEEPTAAANIIERSVQSSQNSGLLAYGPDGNYPEGPSYWEYGTGFATMMCAALESALGSDYGLSNAPGFMESAYYMLFSRGQSGWYFNYSDCGRAVGISPTMFWFAQKENDPSLIFHEIPFVKKGSYTKWNGGSRFLPNALIFGKDMDWSNIGTPSQKMFTGLGTTPVAIVRTSWNNKDGFIFRYQRRESIGWTRPHGPR